MDARQRIPYDNDAERCMLGTMMASGRASMVMEAVDLLSPEDFYSSDNREVFLAVRGIAESGGTPDLVAVNARLRERGSRVGAQYIAALTDMATVSPQMARMAKSLRQLSMRRAAIAEGTRLLNAACDLTEPIGDSIEGSVVRLSGLGLGAIGEESDEFSRLLDTAVERAASKSRPERARTGFRRLDGCLSGGLSKGDYAIVAARPSIGKTAFALTMALGMMMEGKRTALFSLEMSSEQIASRALSIISKVPASAIARGNLTMYDRRRIMRRVAEAYPKSDGLFLVDSPNMPLSALRAKARQLVRKNGVECVIIDYIGIITLTGESGIRQDAPRFEQIAYVSRSLKQLARELEVPVVALCQVNRDSEGSEPMLSNLRDSGAIEQDADLVCFLHRDRTPRSQKADKAERSADRSADKGSGKGAETANEERAGQVLPTKLIVAKNRNGGTGSMQLGFMPAITEFLNPFPKEPEPRDGHKSEQRGERAV